MQRWILWLALATGAIAAAVALYAARGRDLGPVDDAYISLRYAHHWSRGDGLCFNPGEVVEGYTNFLLVALQALALRAGADPEATMTVIGLVCLAYLTALFGWFAARHVMPEHPWAGLVSALVLVLNPTILYWSFSGLEGPLHALLVLAAFVVLPAGKNAPSSIGSALCLVLAAMTRPEAAALLPVALWIVHLRNRKRSRTVTYAAVFVICFGAYFLWRYLHFGHLLPNTFYAKVDWGNRLLLARGTAYVWKFFLAAPTLVLLAGLAVVAIRKPPLWFKGLAAVVGVQLAVVIYEGGDHFALYRFMIAVIPPLAALALYAGAALARKFAEARFIPQLAALIGVVAVGAANLTIGPSKYAGGEHPITQKSRYLRGVRRAETWADMGRWLSGRTLPGETLCTMAVGAVGYYSGLTVIDPLGIVDPVIAHRPSRLGAGTPGHEKYDSDYILSRRPHYLFLVSLPTREPLGPVEQQRELWGPAWLDLYNNPKLLTEYRYENVPYGAEYLNLYVRRDVETPER